MYKAIGIKKLFELEKEAARFGFEWSNYNQIIDQVIAECEEIRDSFKNKESLERIQEEVGDLIHASLSLCRFLGFNFEETINKLNDKFEKRIYLLKKLAKEQNLASLKGESDEFMLELWKEVKLLEKNV